MTFDIQTLIGQIPKYQRFTPNRLQRYRNYFLRIKKKTIKLTWKKVKYAEFVYFPGKRKHLISTRLHNYINRITKLHNQIRMQLLDYSITESYNYMAI